MKNKLFIVFAALAVTVAGATGFNQAQTKRKQVTSTARPSVTTAPAAAPATPLALLPASDGVLHVDIKRLLNEAVPRALAGNPERLAKLNAEMDTLKTRYGLDVRSFERLAVGVRFLNSSPGVTKTDMVAVASGTFNSNTLLAAAKLASKGKYAEQKHAGTSVLVFNVNDQVRVGGLLNMRVRELAVAALDQNTLTFGKPEGVRSVLDARGGRGRVSNDLVALATRAPNAIIGFGANVPASATGNLNFGNEEITRNIAAIRQAYGSFGTSERGFDLLAAARTTQANEAQGLYDALAALKQFGGMMVAQLPADKGRLAQSALEGLKITTQANETQVRLELAQADISELMRMVK